mmetsp:Transcript_45308/g.113982  ORF Transcript_45308/g.113982 Transcript_45308/m.113982 type:complete len:424 (+) Transcript_45308:148-1419(+)
METTQVAFCPAFAISSSQDMEKAAGAATPAKKRRTRGTRAGVKARLVAAGLKPPYEPESAQHFATCPAHAPQCTTMATATMAEHSVAISCADILAESGRRLPIAFAPAFAAASARSLATQQTDVENSRLRGTFTASEVLLDMVGPMPMTPPVESPRGLPLYQLVAVAVPSDWVPVVVSQNGHAVNPKQSASAGTKDEWPSTMTTVMLRNIPNSYTPEELVHDMVQQGFEGMFDFLYLPIDFTTKKNKGYGFLNFRSSATALRFRDAFGGQRLTRYATDKVLDVSPAKTQGLAANACKYLKHQATRIQNPWFKPMIFVPPEDGAEVGTGAVPWCCLPLTEENLPEPIRSVVATLAAVQSKGCGARCLDEHGRPVDALIPARFGSEGGGVAISHDLDSVLLGPHVQRGRRRSGQARHRGSHRSAP